jgi:hypothetical protein
VEIKIKWIPRKQMTHENTYRDDNNNNGGTAETDESSDSYISD